MGDLAQMGRYMGKDGKATNDEKLAALDPKSGKPVDNPLRNLWVTETALTDRPALGPTSPRAWRRSPSSWASR